MVQYLKKKRKLSVRRAIVFSLCFLLAAALVGGGGYLLAKDGYSIFFYVASGFLGFIALLGLLAALLRSFTSPDKSFQRDLGSIHGNPEMERAFDEELQHPGSLSSDHALLTDNWLIYEQRRGNRRALPVGSILWVYRCDQGKTDMPRIPHDLMVMTTAWEIHEIRFKSARDLTEFTTSLHRLLPWIFYGYSRQTARGFRQNIDVFKAEVEEARRLYLEDLPNFHPTLG